MISGIGIDIIEVDRIKNIYKRYGNHFLEKVYTKREIEYCMKKNIYECLSGRFSAKEAVIKATGGRIRFLNEIEILPSSHGPYVNIPSEEKFKITVSISHIRECAIAVAVWENMI